MQWLIFALSNVPEEPNYLFKQLKQPPPPRNSAALTGFGFLFPLKLAFFKNKEQTIYLFQTISVTENQARTQYFLTLPFHVWRGKG